MCICCIMYEFSEFDNEVLKRQLNKTTPNKLNIGFGLDANKIKGVNNFPIYYKTDGFTSRARANTDSFMFSINSSKYDVPNAKHTALKQIRPDLFSDGLQSSSAAHTNTRLPVGKMSSLYGLPPDKTIVLENQTAQAMGKMTENEFKINQLRKSVRDGTLPAEFDEIINGKKVQSSGHGNGSATASSMDTGMDIDTDEDSQMTQYDPHLPSHLPIHSPAPAPAPAPAPVPVPVPAPAPVPIEKKRNRRIDVLPAFGTSVTRNEEIATETLPYVYLEIKEKFRAFLLAHPDKSRDIPDGDREYLDNLLKKFGFKTPNITNVKISAYVTSF
jgi:hypothetical protein